MTRIAELSGTVVPSARGPVSLMTMGPCQPWPSGCLGDISLQAAGPACMSPLQHLRTFPVNAGSTRTLGCSQTCSREPPDARRPTIITGLVRTNAEP